jgi:hypothetical protein
MCCRNIAEEQCTMFSCDQSDHRHEIPTRSPRALMRSRLCLPLHSTISLAIRLACQHMLAPVTHDDALDVTDGHCLLSFLKLYIVMEHLLFSITYNIDVGNYTCKLRVMDTSSNKTRIV